MDHIRILRRAFEITRSYKVLWIFGLFLALTASRASPQSQYSLDRSDLDRFNLPNEIPGWRGWEDFPNWQFTPQLGGTLIAIVIALTCLALILSVLFAILRYVSLTASIRMVNDYEETGEQISFRSGWRLGWDRAALRLFLVDLLFGLAGFTLFILLMAMAAAPLLLWATRNEVMGILGTVSTVGLFVLVILVLIVIAAALSLLSRFFHRAIVLENLGVFDAIRRGWVVFRSRIGDAIIMGLILFGLGLLFAIALIPVALLLVVLGAVVGGLPALAIALAVQQFTQTIAPVIVTAVVVGLPIFLLVIGVPMLFLNGLFEIFTSSTWTLTYREITARELAA
jgi:hypothetical protein